jgi:hypothetical protein
MFAYTRTTFTLSAPVTARVEERLWKALYVEDDLLAGFCSTRGIPQLQFLALLGSGVPPPACISIQMIMMLGLMLIM